MRILILLLLFVPFSANAQFTSRNSALLGFTNNANFEPTDTDSDIYASVTSANNYNMDRHRLGLRLGYRDYVSQNENDSFSWRVSDSWAPDQSDWDYTFDVSGRQYMRGAPATTEYNLNNIGLGVAATRDFEISQTSELSVTPSYSARNFTSYENRTDHNFNGLVEFQYEASPTVAVGARFDLGWVSSNVPDYGRIDFEWGAGVDYDLKDDWAVTADLALQWSLFTSRSISKESIVSRRRGQTVTKTSETNESYSFVGLTAEATRTFTEQLSAGFGLGYSGQDSASGLQNFSALDLFGRLTYRF